MGSNKFKIIKCKHLHARTGHYVKNPTDIKPSVFVLLYIAYLQPNETARWWSFHGLKHSSVTLHLLTPAEEAATSPYLWLQRYKTQQVYLGTDNKRLVMT